MRRDAEVAQATLPLQFDNRRATMNSASRSTPPQLFEVASWCVVFSPGFSVASAPRPCRFGDRRSTLIRRRTTCPVPPERRSTSSATCCPFLRPSVSPATDLIHRRGKRICGSTNEMLPPRRLARAPRRLCRAMLSIAKSCVEFSQLMMRNECPPRRRANP